MTDSGQQSSSESSAADKKRATNNGSSKKELRILMLHGYTQSGPLFRAKTRALEKLLQKALSPLGLVPTLIYPTAPNRLSARDVPGYVPPPPADEGGSAEAEAEADDSDSWAWYRKDEATGAYRLLDAGMRRLAETMRDVVGRAQPPPEPSSSSSPPGVGWGGIDGVVGFSQGGSMAAMLAAAMETLPPPAAAAGSGPGPGSDPAPPPREAPLGADWDWVGAVREANGGVPLRFAVVYSGFYAPPAELAWLYEPPISTPTLHFIGSLDTVVDESRSQGLVARCEDPVVAVHPGGHYVPISKQWVMPLVGFIQKCVS
ncbi:dihydrofolate reductase [Phialemonium atrogriseum]|uniref:Dihydrofolate reductase n=1 Tax=Phialemonium atrogriseum TaxID=1093897 RepID=A0AAJ0BTE0_9PEZI|nr:dihydrofolate reductase [Phialemonium atrogriseum]KAK1764120.1 dihydrofolate reductase [Phialemonium atrogriseum]